MDDNGQHVAQSISDWLACVHLQGEPMKRSVGRYVRSQGGFTLLEVVIASAIGAILMTALTSVILTSVEQTSSATPWAPGWPFT